MFVEDHKWNIEVLSKEMTGADLWLWLQAHSTSIPNTTDTTFILFPFTSAYLHAEYGGEWKSINLSQPDE
jgi:hypothetical protein